MVDLNGEPGVCEICGRSMLAGEHTRTFVSRDRETREVCDLCVVRAESAGWVPVELAGTSPPAEGGEVVGRVRRMLGRARENAAALAARRAETQAERGSGAGAPESVGAAPPPRRPGDTPIPPSASHRTREAAEARPRRRSVPQNPEHRIRRAFDRFNASSHPRTVSGLIRSLGGPWVTAVTDDETPDIVRITVAWELSWYQWEVDLTADASPVRELARGAELSELEEEDRAWNAHAAEDGELRLGLVGSATAG
jgi:hypothetical protein